MNSSLRRSLERLTSDLVNQRYDEIAADGRVGRLTTDELKRAVDDYGRTLIPIPDEGWQLVDEYPQEDSPDDVALDIPLWTEEEGRSDLTLLVTATKRGDDWALEIDDVRVL